MPTTVGGSGVFVGPTPQESRQAGLNRFTQAIQFNQLAKQEAARLAEQKRAEMARQQEIEAENQRIELERRRKALLDIAKDSGQSPALFLASPGGAAAAKSIMGEDFFQKMGNSKETWEGFLNMPLSQQDWDTFIQLGVQQGAILTPEPSGSNKTGQKLNARNPDIVQTASGGTAPASAPAATAASPTLGAFKIVEQNLGKEARSGGVTSNLVQLQDSAGNMIMTAPSQAELLHESQAIWRIATGLGTEKDFKTYYPNYSQEEAIAYAKTIAEKFYSAGFDPHNPYASEQDPLDQGNNDDTLTVVRGTPDPASAPRVPPIVDTKKSIKSIPTSNPDGTPTLAAIMAQRASAQATTGTQPVAAAPTDKASKDAAFMTYMYNYGLFKNPTQPLDKYESIIKGNPNNYARFLAGQPPVDTKGNVLSLRSGATQPIAAAPAPASTGVGASMQGMRSSRELDRQAIIDRARARYRGMQAVPDRGAPIRTNQMSIDPFTPAGAARYAQETVPFSPELSRIPVPGTQRSGVIPTAEGLILPRPTQEVRDGAGKILPRPQSYGLPRTRMPIPGTERAPGTLPTSEGQILPGPSRAMPYGDPAAPEERYSVVKETFDPSPSASPKDRIVVRREFEKIVTDAEREYRRNPSIKDTQYSARLETAATMLNTTDPGGNWQDHPKLTSITKNWADQAWRKTEADIDRLAAETRATTMEIEAALAAGQVKGALAGNTASAALLKSSMEQFKILWEPIIDRTSEQMKDPTKTTDALMKNPLFKESWDNLQKLMIAASGANAALQEVIKKNPIGFWQRLVGVAPTTSSAGSVIVPGAASATGAPEMSTQELQATLGALAEAYQLQ